MIENAVSRTRGRRINLAFGLGLALGLGLELITLFSLLSWRPFVEDSYRTLVVPFVYVSPILLLLVALSRWSDGFHFRWPDGLYAGVTLVSLASFFSVYRGFTPFNPIYSVLSTFTLFLTFRMLWNRAISGRLEVVFCFVVGIVSTEAVHGLLQVVWGSEPKGHMWNRNFLGMFCALVIPFWVALGRSRGSGRYRLQGVLFWSSGTVLLLALVLTKCRSVWLALSVVLPLLLLALWRPGCFGALTGLSWTGKVLLFAGLVLATSGLVWSLYQIRPASALGRILLWRASLNIFADHPISGIGFDQITQYLPVYQARLLEGSDVGWAEKMLPSMTFAAFNQYLRVLVEFGMVGLLFWFPFWLMISQQIAKPFLVLRGFEWKQRSRDGSTHPYDLGLSGSVLVFMIVSVFYFPGTVLVFSVLLAFCLAGLISQDAGVEEANSS